MLLEFAAEMGAIGVSGLLGCLSYRVHSRSHQLARTAKLKPVYIFNGRAAVNCFKLLAKVGRAYFAQFCEVFNVDCPGCIIFVDAVDGGADDHLAALRRVFGVDICAKGVQKLVEKGRALKSVAILFRPPEFIESLKNVKCAVEVLRLYNEGRQIHINLIVEIYAVAVAALVYINIVGGMLGQIYKVACVDGKVDSVGKFICFSSGGVQRDAVIDSVKMIIKSCAGEDLSRKGNLFYIEIRFREIVHKLHL